jgi:hypothetical protein
MSDNGRYTSYEEVINMLHRDFKWASGYWTDEDVLYSIKSILRLVGAANVYKDTHAFVKIEEGRGSTPKDMFLISTIAKIDKVKSIEEAINCKDGLHFIPMRWMTDLIKRVLHVTARDFWVKSNYTYTVNNNYMFTNFDEGVVCIFYKTLAKDSNGNLMIPENESYIKAIAYDVALKAATNMFMWDKLTKDKFQLIDRDRDWYVAQAGNSSKIPNLDRRTAQKNNNLSWPGEYFPETNFHLNLYKRQSIT